MCYSLDQWFSYQNLCNYGYAHFTVNNSENFIDLISEVHTQNVENMLIRSKKMNKNNSGTRIKLIESYCIEFM